MLGSQYATLDQRLADGKIDRTEYGATVLCDLIARSVSFAMLVYAHTTSDAVGVYDRALLSQAAERFRNDCEEAAARGTRAELFAGAKDGFMTYLKPLPGDLDPFGGSLVSEKEG